MDDRLRRLANKALEAAGADPILSEEEKQAAYQAEVQRQAKLVYRKLKFGTPHNLPFLFGAAEDLALGWIQQEKEEEAAKARALQAQRARAEAERQARIAAEEAVKEAAEKLRLDRIANIEKHYPTIWD